MNTEWTIALMILTALGTALMCVIGGHADHKAEMKEVLEENKELRKEIAYLKEMLNRL